MNITPDMIAHIKKEYPEHLKMLTAEPKVDHVMTAELAKEARDYFGEDYDEGIDLLEWMHTDVIQFAVEQRITWFLAFRTFCNHRSYRKALKEGRAL